MLRKIVVNLYFSDGEVDEATIIAEPTDDSETVALLVFSVFQEALAAGRHEGRSLVDAAFVESVLADDEDDLAV